MKNELNEQIVKLIQLSALNEKNIFPLISVAYYNLPEESKKNCSLQDLSEKVFHFVSSTEFLASFIDNFKKTFTEKQIANLLDMYESEEMKIMQKEGSNLFSKIYENIPYVVKEISKA